MTERYGRLGTAAVALTVACCAAEFWLSLVGPGQAADSTSLTVALTCLVVLPPLEFSAVGLIITRRARETRIGWVLCAIGVLFGLGFVFTDAPPYLFRHDVRGPGLLVPAVIGTYIWPAFLVSVVALLLLFPTGRSLPGFWRRVLPWAIPVTGVSVVLSALSPGRLTTVPINNPLALPYVPELAAQAQVVVSVGLLLLGVAGLVQRFRVSRGEERQQLKWFTYSGAVTAVFFLGAFTGTLLGTILTFGYFLAITMIPIAIGIAITRYHLYDIDAIINRTLVYAVLTGSLVALYAASVLGLQSLLKVLTGGAGDLAVAVATLAVAAAFNPWRHRLQAFIDRRFYRSKYDAARTLAHFMARLRDDVDLDQLSDDIVTVVHETVQPATVSLWVGRGQGPVPDSSSQTLL